MSSWQRGSRDGRGRGSRKKRGGRNTDVSHLGNGSIGNFFGPVTPGRNEPDLSMTVTEENRPKTAAELSQEIVLRNEPQQNYTIGGVKVQFPCKPYPSQFSIINKIVKGLDSSQNCLLESPTGSGKSLALLCSALAWQQAQKEKMKKEEGSCGDCCCACHRRAYSESPYFPPVAPSATVSVPPDNPDGSAKNSSIIIDDDDDEDDDFKKPVKKLRTSGQGAAGGRQHIVIQYDDPPTGAQATPTVNLATPTMRGDTPMEEDSPCTCQCDEDMSAKRKVPKIYFGTRTHKQIAQIARELAKTAYRDVRMCILASREHTCIDAEVSKMKKKNEECKNKLDGPGCLYHENVRKITHRNMEVNGLEFAWDLEDFVKFNKRHKSCPFFASRQLREGADIIFCPYNYLIDPIIRDNMEIMLKDEIVILDEAHNMEDSARDAASYSVTHSELEDGLADIDYVLKYNVKPITHTALRNVMQSLLNWVENFRHTLGGGDYDQASKVWNGMDMVAQLKSSNIGPDDLPELWQHLNKAVEQDNERENAPPLPKISTPTAIILEKTFYMLGYIYRNDFKYMNDYRIALVRTISYTSEQNEGQWLGKNRRASYRQTFLFTLHFWCMNPAVAFSDLTDVRSIILTSGTLSPMTSFQSELGRPFPIQLEANHVINAKQVWVGAISKGPRGGNLLGSYQTSETFSYQDELGQLVLSVCKTVPHGVLCFLSSYKMLDKLYNRWQSTGLYGELTKCKVVMKEPRASDRDRVDFDELLRQFYAIIRDTEKADASAGEQTGVFFMAVCRGKVSEGMDFADNNARAVITVGIPFPNFKDTQVELKKKYNNEHSGSRGLLSGSDWYEIQAYRAINQALGRCIRHRYDWGALVLVDERFAKNPAKYSKGLSKWVRQKVQYYGNFFQAQRSLQEFTENMIATPPGPGQDQTLSVSQMDLSMAVETHPPFPSSPLPPVLPPAPSTSTSPPMDLNSTTGGATQNLLSATLSHQGATNYALPSQAGGFFVSQDQSMATQGGMRHNTTQGNITSTQSQPGDLTQLNMAIAAEGVGTQAVNGAAVHVVAAPPPTQPMDLDQTLDFAPPLASTQLPGRFSFDPGMTSTQLHSQKTPRGAQTAKQAKVPANNNNNTPLAGNLVSMIKKQNGNSPVDKSVPGQLNFERKGNAVRQKLAKFARKEKDEDPEWEIPRTETRSRRQSGASKRLSQSVDPVSHYGDEDINIDERSNSPLLFDAEDGEGVTPNSEDFDAVVEHIADRTCPQAKPDVSTSKPDSNQNLGKRPLFKAKENGVAQEEKKVEVVIVAQCNNKENSPNKVNLHALTPDENIPPVAVEEKNRRRSLKGRLSRKRSNESMNTSSIPLTPNPKENPANPPKQEEPQKNTRVSKENLKSSRSKSVKPRTNLKRPPKGIHFDSEGEEGEEQEEGEVEEAGELRTKRSSRSKRRRVVAASTCAPTSEFLKDMQPTETMASSVVSCNQCGSCLYRSLQGMREEELPGYVISVLPGWNKRKAAPRVAVCDQTNPRLTQLQLIEETLSSGLSLNSTWSVEAGCCFKFYRCPSDQCDSTPVAVCIAAKTSQSTVKEGQVWFLPLATSISEPT